jgi:regulator of PEP synthase PpsR (kinase-PPPase family)
MKTERPPTLFVVSDSRGQTGNAVMNAALVQFEHQRYAIVRESNVRTRERIEAIVDAAARTRGVVFYTLVADETRRAMQQAAASRAVPVVDVLGPALSALHDLFRREPQAEPGLLYASEREESDRLSAIDYTLKHDDGRRPDELAAADVVLVGVSRTGKSVTCFYLAYQGVKAANVPLVPGQPLPAELDAVPAERVIGLWVNPGRLVALREARAQNLRLASHGAYTDLEAVKQEVRAALHAMSERGWRAIDGSYMAVEEIARDVMRLRGLAEHSLG